MGHINWAGLRFEISDVYFGPAHIIWKNRADLDRVQLAHTRWVCGQKVGDAEITKHPPSGGPPFAKWARGPSMPRVTNWNFLRHYSATWKASIRSCWVSWRGGHVWYLSRRRYPALVGWHVSPSGGPHRGGTRLSRCPSGPHSPTQGPHLPSIAGILGFIIIIV